MHLYHNTTEINKATYCMVLMYIQSKGNLQDNVKGEEHFFNFFFFFLFHSGLYWQETFCNLHYSHSFQICQDSKVGGNVSGTLLLHVDSMGKCYCQNLIILLTPLPPPLSPNEKKKKRKSLHTLEIQLPHSPKLAQHWFCLNTKIMSIHIVMKMPWYAVQCTMQLQYSTTTGPPSCSSRTFW